MDANVLGISLLLAVGTGLIGYSLLATLFEVVERWVGRGKRAALASFFEDRAGSRTLRSGVGLSWRTLYAASGVLALALYAASSAVPSLLRPGLLALPALVWLARRGAEARKLRALPGQVRHFLIDIRLYMSLEGSLLRGLERLAEVSSAPSAVASALRCRLKGGSARTGVDLLEALALDLSSDLLSRAAARVRASMQAGGVVDADRALAGVIEELNTEISSRTEEQLQRLPLRITLLAMPFLLGPIVILLFYPLVDRILKTLSGVSVGGGF
ncbi:MAG: hypothetical protein NTZ74_01720 [Chloroflexi bacterium]|nr:hypothetical protein [Chloroflexota bacterium]